QTFTRHHGLEEIGAAAKGHVLGGEALGFEVALIEGDDDRPGHRVVAEHGTPDLDRGLRSDSARRERCRPRRKRGAEEPATRDHGHGRWLLWPQGSTRPAALTF